MEASFATIAQRFDEIIANFPARPVAWLLRFLIQPLGPRRRGPSDRVTAACAAIIAEPSATRDRLTAGPLPAATTSNGPRSRIRRAPSSMTVAVQPIRDRMRNAQVRDVAQAREAAHHHRGGSRPAARPPPRRSPTPSLSMISRRRN